VGFAEGGLACVLAEARTPGFRAAGLAAVARGASTVTGGKAWLAVCALAPDGMAESALPNASRLALPKARQRNI